ncbi:hypothetical protein L1987_26446 [Smallanthus sonchifolius]|uniref:Uncharacterized protein n=1 Tax=Smallanthus sonchifolius TaxID=185202 RepID=A0ACB9IAI7_9ASTR|nr:hypothetical protein L1987_26446 [Smallanthus sonchifolius]
MYVSGRTDSFPVPDFKPVSGLTSTLPISRKRLRDSSSFNPQFSVLNTPNVNLNNGHWFGEFTFLGEDVSLQIYQQQLEIDRLIAHHVRNSSSLSTVLYFYECVLEMNFQICYELQMEKVRSEIEEMRKQNSRRLILAVHEGIMKRLKTKEEEILKIGRMNWSLEEKVKSLSVENQILKELVQSNEATANALRNKLQQVLAQVQLQQQHHHLDFADNGAKATVLMVDDAESHCGSNYEEDHRHDGGERKVIDANDENEDCNPSSRYGRWCRKCRKLEKRYWSVKVGLMVQRWVKGEKESEMK